MASRPKARTKSKRDKFLEDFPPLEVMSAAVSKKTSLPLSAKSDKQKKYMAAIRAGKLIFGLGPAGTGKTYVAAAMAADALVNKQIERIIVTRPAVDAGESMGFLPGELEEKYAPYLAPFRDVLDERLGKSHVENLLKLERIEPQPLAYMRGRTFRDAFVILDEAQNTTPAQMKMFLTRIGENCTVIVDGDETQKDIPGPSGLTDAIGRLSDNPSVKIIRFDKKDIVRSGLVQQIIEAYEK